MSTVPFAYRAAHPSGMLENGVVQADTPDAAREQLFARGLFPLEVRLERAAERRRPGLPPADLALGLRVLATLLESGLSVHRSLAALDELAPVRWRPALGPMRAAVREGKSLATALAEAPLDIPPLVVGLVQAGEAGSGLAQAVARAAELTESAAATRRAIRAALAYPLLLAVAGAGSIALLVGFVLPRFTAILADLGQRLPPAARLVVALSDGARAGFLPVLVLLVAGLVLGRVWVESEAGRMRWHAFLLAVPLVGPIRRASAVARFSSALSALLESGVPIAPALGHATRAAGDSALAARILAAREEVVGGRGISASLEAANAATPTVLRLVRTGEETGRLAPMLAQAARIEHDRAETLTRGAVRVIEPALILTFGAIVALVAAGLLQAVYAVRPTP